MGPLRTLLPLPLLHSLRVPAIAAAWLLGGGALAHPGSAMLHLATSFGLFGLFLVAVVDSSFVPLPIPGVTDVMLILYAAQHQNPWLLIAVSSIASAIGGGLSYQVGHAGGLAFIEKRTPKRIFARVTRWMESHAILAVALPAILPPPMPLSPFVLAAGALNMRFRTFIVSFSLSRLARHAFAVWLGVHYGPAVLTLWNRFTAKYGVPILIFLWTGILVSVGYALWQLWKTSHSVGAMKGRGKPMANAPAA